MLLAHIDLNTEDSDIQVYVVPSGKKATATIRVVNRTNDNVKVRLAISDTNTLDDSFYITYNQTIYPGDTYTEAVVVLDEGQFIFAQTDTVGVNVVVWGFEQA